MFQEVSGRLCWMIWGYPQSKLETIDMIPSFTWLQLLLEQKNSTRLKSMASLDMKASMKQNKKMNI